MLRMDWAAKKEEMPRERPRPRERVEGRARDERRRAGIVVYELGEGVVGCVVFYLLRGAGTVGGGMDEPSRCLVVLPVVEGQADGICNLVVIIAQ